MLTLQQGFSATMKQLWQGVQQAIGNAISTIISNWLSQQISALLLGKATQQTAGVGQIASNAAVASAAAFASTAAIPVVGPEMAPEAAATAYAAVMAMQGLLAAGSFDVGAKQLSKDQLALVHAGETIIPAGEAGGWRAVMEMAAAMPRMVLPASLSSPYASTLPRQTNSSAPAAGNEAGSGDTHNYYLQAMDSVDVAKFMKRNAPAVGAAVRSYVRAGGKTDKP